MSRKRKRAPDSSGTSTTTTIATSTGKSTSSQPVPTAPVRNAEATTNTPRATQAKPEVSSGHLNSQKATSTTRALPAPKWLYLQLQPIVARVLAKSSATSLPAKQSFKLDETTLRLHLLSALSAYLGDTGAAIPVDILKLSLSGDDEITMATEVTMEQIMATKSNTTTGHTKLTLPEAYLRVPYGDSALFCAAVTSWAGTNNTGGSAVGGYRILEKSCWLSCLDLHDRGLEDDLFDFGVG